ncbi:MAG: ABC transporter substrate-binding protein [Desulfovibrio sp.]|nr:ABC transporter substrate-binding protein [Desulfovibrio sp.]
MRACVRFFAVGLLCAFVFATNAYAESAKESLERSFTLVLEILKNPDYADPVKRPPLREKIANLVRSQFDAKEFSTRTLGPKWQTMTAAQQESFASAFVELLIQTYVNKVNGYHGEQISVVGEKSNPKGDRKEIQTIVLVPSGKKIPINYRMLPKGDTWMVYDVLIEQISLVKNYRTQFQELFKTQSIDAVIERIRAKTKELAENANDPKSK